MKYIIEIKPEYEDTTRGIMVLGARDSNLYMDALAVEDMEELNSDYINEHFGDLQDTAYQRGLDDAWEAARKIIRMPEGNILDLFPDCYASVCTAVQAILKYDTSEAVAKLKAYEEKQKANNCIEIGDEVKWNGDKCIVTYRNMDINTGVVQDYDLMMWDGSVADHVKKCCFAKTGNRYDISSILKEMQS